ncbi:MAG: hypothetical protein HC845_11660 [Akkermansiaceae bacterium]|nr:hypothetical protein [Akkermansiaceae bacterium]
MASSADGTKLVAADLGGQLYTDNASGAAGYALPRASGTSGSQATLVFNGNDWVEVSNNTFNAPVTFNASVTATGHMGIGTVPDASFRLDVNGLIRTTGAVNTSSDRRFKQDIQPISGALEKVSRLQGVSYDWNRTAFPDKNFADQRQIGFIARDVKEVLPELVTQDDQGYLSVAYSSTVPVLVEAVKELKGENAEIKNENAELKSRLQRLEKMVEAQNPRLSASE